MREKPKNTKNALCSNHVVNKMMERDGAELTWEDYLDFAYLGDPPEPSEENNFLAEDFADFQNAKDELLRGIEDED